MISCLLECGWWATQSQPICYRIDTRQKWNVHTRGWSRENEEKWSVRCDGIYLKSIQPLNVSLTRTKAGIIYSFCYLQQKYPYKAYKSSRHRKNHAGLRTSSQSLAHELERGNSGRVSGAAVASEQVNTVTRECLAVQCWGNRISVLLLQFKADGYLVFNGHFCWIHGEFSASK